MSDVLATYTKEPAPVGAKVRWRTWAIQVDTAGEIIRPAVGERVHVSCFAGRDGPVPLVEITADLGPVNTDDDPEYSQYHGSIEYTGYWRFEGVVVGHEADGSAPPPVSDQFGHHFGRLAADD
jgi:hypothetical protein